MEPMAPPAGYDGMHMAPVSPAMLKRRRASRYLTARWAWSRSEISEVAKTIANASGVSAAIAAIIPAGCAARFYFPKTPLFNWSHSRYACFNAKYAPKWINPPLRRVDTLPKTFYLRRDVCSP
ncbi:hypothetical protein KCP73_01865 [Salmonella enterica subsp. enterica]|nr:hypothetical protein KCP73_01865 [Salmonella enterica subsp. enterica]